MRVLWLTPELPMWPGGTGGQTRQFQLVRRLVELGHAVDVVAPVHPDQHEGALGLTAAGVTLHGRRRPASRARETAGAVVARPALAAGPLRRPVVTWQVDVLLGRLGPELDAALARRPDVALIEHDWAAAWARRLPAALPRAVGLENLSWLYYANRARAATGAQAALLRAEAKRFARFDRRELARFDLLVAVSEEDREALAGLVDVPSAVVANGVSITGFGGTAAPAPGVPPTFLFTGTLDYAPNAEALTWLLGEIWPRIRARRPDARLKVVGRGATDDHARLADEHVELVGWLPDIQPAFADASVILAPMRSGGGTRLKILDALASRRPLVTTRMGAEGVPVVPGRDAILAEAPAAFADAAVDLLEDPARAASLAASGRRLVEERFDWDALGGRLADALGSLTVRPNRA